MLLRIHLGVFEVGMPFLETTRGVVEEARHARVLAEYFLDGPEELQSVCLGYIVGEAAEVKDPLLTDLQGQPAIELEVYRWFIETAFPQALYLHPDVRQTWIRLEQFTEVIRLWERELVQLIPNSPYAVGFGEVNASDQFWRGAAVVHKGPGGVCSGQC